MTPDYFITTIIVSLHGTVRTVETLQQGSTIDHLPWEITVYQRIPKLLQYQPHIYFVNRAGGP